MPENKMPSESMFDNGKVIIPMADVQHIEYQSHPTIGRNGILVITKHTHWNFEHDNWDNAIHITENIKQEFIKAFCIYRSEIESVK